jgi:hypothetical protein
LERVLQKVRLDRATIVVIAPLWPTRPFMPELLDLLCDFPIVLPPLPDLLRPPPGKQFTYLPPTDFRRHRLCAWKVSGDPVKSHHFRRRLRSWPFREDCDRPLTLDELRDHLPILFMRLND